MKELPCVLPEHLQVRSNQTQWRPILITLLTYWVLVMGMWGMFSLDRGLTFETGFPVACQKSLHDCLVYGDSLRPYNSLFLGLGHLLGKGNGSYVTYQLLYGFLWWGRGVLTFLIFRRIWSAYPIVGFLVGALVIVHASDGALNWIGQLHQFGFMFCLVLAVYLLLEGWQTDNKILSFSFLIASLFPLYISLWTYESQYFIILSVPLILFALHPKLTPRLLFTTAIWYILPAIYGYLQLEKYLVAKVSNYQTSVVRPDLSSTAIFKDLGTHLGHSLQFWHWAETLPVYGVALLAPVVAGVCVIAFIVGSHLLSLGFPSLRLPPVSHLIVSLGFGLLLLVLSFPVYLLLAGNTTFWRTQMLSGFGAAIVLGSVFLLVAKLLMKDRYQALLAITACSIVVFAGVNGGMKFQGFHEYRWQIHRNLMAQISHLLPDVENHTLILLTNLPKEYSHDPFGAAMWFDFPTQLLYPTKEVVGYFIYEKGDQPKDNPWRFTAKGMEWEKKGMGQDFTEVSYNQIVALRYELDGKISILDKFPANLLPQKFDVSGYAPYSRIRRDFITNRSIRIFSR
jgi:hypothetical protein